MAELEWVPAAGRPDLVAAPVAAALAAAPGARVAPIDASLADTAAFCEHYGVAPETSANCVVVATRRGGAVTYAAFLVLAVDRADVNGAIRRHLGARKASFAPTAEATGLTGMEYGGITPVGLPAGWPVLVDTAVAGGGDLVVGAGIRGAKLLVSGGELAALPGAEVVDLAQRG